jgi:hypothetical protein
MQAHTDIQPPVPQIEPLSLQPLKKKYQLCPGGCARCTATGLSPEVRSCDGC